MEEEKNKYRSSAEKREGPELIRRNRHILDDNIKTDLQKEDICVLIGYIWFKIEESCWSFLKWRWIVEFHKIMGILD